MITPFERAIKSDQYDLGDLLWVKEGRADTTRTGYFWEYLEPYVEGWKGKTVLDIGAGTGWLVSKALEKGAVKAVGIEPAKNNVAQGLQDHPEVSLVNASLEAFDGMGEHFDRIVAVMSFSHIADIDSAFSKIRSMIDDIGELILLVPDYDYFKIQRHDYQIETQEIDADQYAVSVTRPSGTLADIIRRPSVYINAAEHAGFKLLEEKPMPPTETQMVRAPKYATVKNQALTQLLRFRVAQ
ncbi:hypothetical protein A2765_02660 [Candidatus Kaiserbacteria bacterium RIFCSPHIGHO2_01_FULL_56_24]|uniref:Methyltransferase domain-containing protein n=1 Tax=Candidatus Kaiserbacteria bacterium RIFCSPHIGHO2_01_FULL_56_24 TaxID=1798487 RepID=A0A1F6DB05_9BACT|nr:MAG: hypothetical protein A2765_02660 [Candidatus Kaiserbacteria bacterium RIFCSPHIGHO2_01_FULL_56_24]